MSVSGSIMTATASRDVPPAAHEQPSGDQAEKLPYSESVVHYREANLSKWRFGFLCVG